MAVTNVEKFILTYVFQGKTVTVNCQRYNIDGKTVVWVPVLNNKGFIKYTHVFWENLVEGTRFFRYPLSGKKEREAKNIERALHVSLSDVI